MDGMEHLRNIAALGTTFPTFYSARSAAHVFLINLTFTSFKGSFISVITHTDQSFVPERTAT